MDGCAKLAREEMRRVGALRKLQGDMSSLSKWIQTQMMEELQVCVWGVGCGVGGGLQLQVCVGGGGGGGCKMVLDINIEDFV